MARDPLADMADAPLFVVPRMLEKLRAFRPALDGVSEPGRARLAAELDNLRGRLLAGIERQPTKFWVMKQFQRSLDVMQDEDAETRKRIREALEELMGILGIEDQSGVLDHYP